MYKAKPACDFSVFLPTTIVKRTLMAFNCHYAAPFKKVSKQLLSTSGQSYKGMRGRCVSNYGAGGA